MIVPSLRAASPPARAQPALAVHSTATVEYDATIRADVDCISATRPATPPAPRTTPVAYTAATRPLNTPASAPSRTPAPVTEPSSRPSARTVAAVVAVENSPRSSPLPVTVRLEIVCPRPSNVVAQPTTGVQLAKSSSASTSPSSSVSKSRSTVSA